MGYRALLQRTFTTQGWNPGIKPASCQAGLDTTRATWEAQLFPSYLVIEDLMVKNTCLGAELTEP